MWCNGESVRGDRGSWRLPCLCGANQPFDTCCEISCNHIRHLALTRPLPPSPYLSLSFTHSLHSASLSPLLIKVSPCGFVQLSCWKNCVWLVYYLGCLLTDPAESNQQIHLYNVYPTVLLWHVICHICSDIWITHHTPNVSSYYQNYQLISNILILSILFKNNVGHLMTVLKVDLFSSVATCTCSIFSV